MAATDFPTNYGFEQYITAYPGNPVTPALHNDIALEQPELTSPEDNVIICRRSGVITLTWGAVTNADFYVVQWAQNSSFTGATVNGVKVTAPTVTKDLAVGSEVLYGKTYYWRVMAYNTTGGAGPKSEAREFKIECETADDTDGGDGSDETSCENLHDVFIYGDESYTCGSTMYLVPYGKIKKGVITGYRWIPGAGGGAHLGDLFDALDPVELTGGIIGTFKKNAVGTAHFIFELTILYDMVEYICQVEKHVKVDCPIGYAEKNGFCLKDPPEGMLITGGYYLEGHMKYTSYDHTYIWYGYALDYWGNFEVTHKVWQYCPWVYLPDILTYQHSFCYECFDVDEYNEVCIDTTATQIELLPYMLVDPDSIGIELTGSDLRWYADLWPLRVSKNDCGLVVAVEIGSATPTSVSRTVPLYTCP